MPGTWTRSPRCFGGGFPTLPWGVQDKVAQLLDERARLRETLDSGNHVVAIFTILGVLHDGTYALCGIGTSVPELCFGNAKTSHVREIWEHTEVLQQIRTRLPKDLKGICARCVVRNVCLGQCVANNYYVAKDLFAGHQFCEEALSAGAFPQTRLA